MANIFFYKRNILQESISSRCKIINILIDALSLKIRLDVCAIVKAII